MLTRLRSTIRFTATLFMARTFGKYQHCVGGGDFTYAVYRWRGQEWAFPLGAMDEGI